MYKFFSYIIFQYITFVWITSVFINLKLKIVLIIKQNESNKVFYVKKWSLSSV